MRSASSRAGTLSRMQPSRMRSGGPPVLRMFVCPLPTCPSRLLTRSRVSGGTIPAHAGSGWVLAIALLGLEALSGVVRQAFGRGLIEPIVMGYDDFRRDLGRTLADPERMAGFQFDQIGPLEDAIGELSSWYAFSGKHPVWAAL